MFVYSFIVGFLLILALYKFKVKYVILNSTNPSNNRPTELTPAEKTTTDTDRVPDDKIISTIVKPSFENLYSFSTVLVGLLCGLAFEFLCAYLTQ